MDEYFHNHYTLDTVRISSYPCRIDCFSVLGTKTQICVGRDAILPLRLRWLLVRRQCAKYRYLWWRRSCKKLAQTCADQPQKAIPARATRPFSETLKETRGRSSMRSGSGREGKLSFLRIAGSALQSCNRDRYCSKTASAAATWTLPRRKLPGHSPPVPVLIPSSSFHLLVESYFRPMSETQLIDKCVSLPFDPGHGLRHVFQLMLLHPIICLA